MSSVHRSLHSRVKARRPASHKSAPHAATPAAPEPSVWRPDPAFAKPALPVVVVVGLVAVSLLAGMAAFWPKPYHSSTNYVEVYATDLPANFTQLEVHVAGVFVGAEAYPLPVIQSQFDLLSLHGIGDALLIARGYVPQANHTEIRIEFASARALINGTWHDLPVPKSLLTVGHDYGLDRQEQAAILFDFNVDASVTREAGGLVFNPRVAALYVHELDESADERAGGTSPDGSKAPDGDGSRPNPFIAAANETPKRQETSEPEPDDASPDGVAPPQTGPSRSTKTPSPTSSTPSGSSTPASTPGITVPTDTTPAPTTEGVAPSTEPAQSTTGTPLPTESPVPTLPTTTEPAPTSTTPTSEPLPTLPTTTESLPTTVPSLPATTTPSLPPII